MELKKGQTAIVTGAANGVGLSLSRLLLQKGLKVVMLDNDRDALASLAETLKSEGSVSAYQCDITNEEAIISTRKAIASRHSEISLLINNAGVSADVPFEEHKMDDFRWVLETNLMGAVYMCRHFLQGLKAAGSAHIINVASAAAIFGFPGKTAYCASKFGLKGFSQSLRAELHKDHVGVTIAILGPVNTDMISRSRVSDSEKREKMQSYLHKKGMNPEEVARQLLQAVERNKPRVLISSESRALALFDRLMPNSFLRLLTRFQNQLPA